eukprot:1398209-Rhodomonas_salina.2
MSHLVGLRFGLWTSLPLPAPYSFEITRSLMYTSCPTCPLPFPYLIRLHSRHLDARHVKRVERNCRDSRNRTLEKRRGEERKPTDSSCGDRDQGQRKEGACPKHRTGKDLCSDPLYVGSEESLVPYVPQ